jgi:hypothetical protein
MSSDAGASLVVLGSSLAAGLVNFTVHEDDQRRAFPQLVARALGVPLATPWFEPPGVGEAIGFSGLPTLVPHEGQTTVLKELPVDAAFDNLAIPGLTLAEAIQRRPMPPLLHENDPKQTALNLVLGTPALLSNTTGRLLSQVEYAQARRPMLTIVELGFAEAIEAVAAGAVDRLPSVERFREDYTQVLSALTTAGGRVVVTTVPDPMDTAYCHSVDAAARVLHLPPAALLRDYGLRSGDRILVDGLTEIGVQIMAKRVAALPAKVIVNAETAAAISARISSVNSVIRSLASEHRAAVADFAGLYRAVCESGLRAGSRVLTGDLLGGFFSLNGYTPGATGQAALANLVIDAINAAAESAAKRVDLAEIASTDAVADYRPAIGPAFRTTAGRLAAARATAQLVMFLVGFVAKAIAGAIRRKKERRPESSGSDPSRWTMRLPPGMVQVLPLDSHASFYGDALRPVHTTIAAEQEYGISGRLLFKGFALLDSHLHGRVRIKFYPPVDNVAHFEVTHPGGGLSADDGLLSAPVFFKLAAVQHKVMDSTAELSTGDLNLITGEVTNLRYTLFFLNSAILALAAVNPALPKDPLAFPGQWGRTWARFDQRSDGLLDYTCYGTSFVPLSVLRAPIRFPLPFTSPSGSVASIPGDGTALHPHFHMSTKPVASRRAAPVPELSRTVRSMQTQNGRWQVQFGEQFGGMVSIAVQSLPQKGVYPAPAAAPPKDPVADQRLNVPVGAVDLSTGTIVPEGGSSLPDLAFDAAFDTSRKAIV